MCVLVGGPLENAFFTLNKNELNTNIRNLNVLTASSKIVLKLFNRSLYTNNLLKGVNFIWIQPFIYLKTYLLVCNVNKIEFFIS